MKERSVLSTLLIIVVIVIVVILLFQVLGKPLKGSNFQVKQNSEGGYFHIFMFDKDLFQIEVNPCDSLAAQDIDPNNYLGGLWDIYYHRLPNGDFVVLYFDGKAIEQVPLIKKNGSHYSCP